MFVHLTREDRVSRILRAGLGRLRRGTSTLPSGIYATPVTRNFYVSHQWLRELRRRGPSPVAAIYFRIDDEEPVWVGHYGGRHQQMRAAEAVSTFLSADVKEGWEVLIPRRIGPQEIHRVRGLRQIVGWRYYPGAHGRKPCACDFCTRGAIGGARIRRRLGPK